MFSKEMSTFTQRKKMGLDFWFLQTKKNKKNKKTKKTKNKQKKQRFLHSCFFAPALTECCPCIAKKQKKLNQK